MTETLELPSPRSYSQYNTFTRCSEAYYLEKIAKAPRLPAAWFTQGSAFHYAAETWEQSGRTLGPAMVEALYHQEWDRLHAIDLEREPNIDLWLTGGRVKPADDIVRRKAKGAEQILAYLEYAVASEWQPVMFAGEYACEYPFEMDFGGITVRGSIDQIVEHKPTGRLMVRDLKTGTKLPEDSLQLAVYDLAIEDDWGVRPGWGDYYMAKNNAATSPYDLSFYTKELLSGWFDRMDKGVREGIFLPNPGDVCRTCGVSKFCSAKGVDMTYQIGRNTQ